MTLGPILNNYQDTITFPAHIAIPSVNQLYIVRRSRSRAWLSKNEKVEEFQTIFSNLISKSKLTEIIEVSKSVKSMDIELDFYFSKSYSSRDLDNVLKICLDTVSKSIEINDNKIVRLRCSKNRSNSPTESVKISINTYH